VTTYGPHRDQDAPNAVTVLGPNRWPAAVVRPLPAALVRQRRELNERARRAALGLAPVPPSGFRPLPVQARADNPAGRARLVECAQLARRGLPVPLMWGGPRG
jgi:hypothetical protein